MRGITINNSIHTGNDLCLVMTEKNLPPPTVQTYSVSVPGRNGSVDLSEFLTGEVTYNNRTLSFKFIGDGSREHVLELIDEMLSYHGQKVEIITDDYPDWYYTGRATVEYVDSGYYATFQLTVDAQPFSYAIRPKTYDFKVKGSRQISLYNCGVTVIPTVTVDKDTTIIKGQNTLRLSAGTYESSALKLLKGATLLIFEGDCNVTITYREAVI